MNSKLMTRQSLYTTTSVSVPNSRFKVKLKVLPVWEPLSPCKSTPTAQDACWKASMLKLQSTTISFHLHQFIVPTWATSTRWTSLAKSSRVSRDSMRTGSLLCNSDLHSTGKSSVVLTSGLIRLQTIERLGLLKCSQRQATTSLWWSSFRSWPANQSLNWDALIQRSRMSHRRLLSLWDSLQETQDHS